MLIAGFLSGVLAGLTGIGTGIILGPLLLSANLTDDKKVSPIINFLIMIACLSSSFNYTDLVRYDYAFYIAIPAIITGYFGRKLNTSISPKRRRFIVASCLIILMIKTIVY